MARPPKGVVVTPPTGILSANPPDYPGRNVDWKLQYYIAKKNMFTFSLPTQLTELKKKSKTLCLEGQTMNLKRIHFDVHGIY